MCSSFAYPHTRLRRRCFSSLRCMTAAPCSPLSETMMQSTIPLNHLTTEVTSLRCFNRHGVPFQCRNPFLWAFFQQGKCDCGHLKKRRAEREGCFVEACFNITQLYTAETDIVICVDILGCVWEFLWWWWGVMLIISSPGAWGMIYLLCDWVCQQWNK